MAVLIIFLKVLITIFIIFIGLLLMLLIIPFKYDLHVEIKEKIEGETTIRWLWGFFKFKYLSTDEIKSFKMYITKFCINVSQAPEKIKNKKKKEKNNTLKEKKHKQKRSIQDFLQKEFLYNTAEFLKKVVSIIKPKVFKANGVYGFEDPAFTGLVCGLESIIRPFIPNCKINLEPIFNDEIIDVDIQISGVFILFSILIKTLKFVFKKENRKVIFNKPKTAETF